MYSFFIVKLYSGVLKNQFVYLLISRGMLGCFQSGVITNCVKCVGTWFILTDECLGVLPGLCNQWMFICVRSYPIEEGVGVACCEILSWGDIRSYICSLTNVTTQHEHQ